MNQLHSELTSIAESFTTQYNDHSTRSKVVEVIQEYLGQITSVDDFAVVCDENNNTPERINANELWVDVAVKETDSETFTFYPIRVTPLSVNGDPIG